MNLPFLTLPQISQSEGSRRRPRGFESGPPVPQPRLTDRRWPEGSWPSRFGIRDISLHGTSHSETPVYKSCDCVVVIRHKATCS